MASKMKTLIFVCLTGLLAIGSTGSFAVVDVNGCPDPLTGAIGCVVPDITPGSYPFFDQAADVQFKETKKGYKINAKFLKGSGRSWLVGPDDVYGIQNTKLNLKAVMKNGEFSGTVSIKGKIADLDLNKQRELMKADLVNINYDGPLVGFDTMGIQCDQAISDAVGCTDNESVYLSLIEDITAEFAPFGDGDAKNIKTAGVAVTTVPIPAAVWLFASGLLGLAGVARRNSRKD